MILILRKNEIDISTNQIIGWLESINASFYVFDIDNIEGYGELIKVRDNVNVIWAWRVKPSFKEITLDEIRSYLECEAQIILEEILYEVDRKGIVFPWNSIHPLNKLIVLDVARELGLSIPNSYLLVMRS